MTENSSAISHLFADMTTKAADMMQTTSKNTMTMTLSSYSGIIFFFHCTGLVIGVLGTASNALILYALAACNEHKKHAQIVNQNALDLFSGFFLLITYVVKLCNIRLIGAQGYWLCITILSQVFVSVGTLGSTISIAAITIERYLKVVHSKWSKKWLHPWVIYSAMVFAWLAPIIVNAPMLFETSAVINGVCYAFALYKNDEARMAVLGWYVSSFYILMIFIFTFCYWRIVVVIRRQASVMASHGDAGSSSTQSQSLEMQSINVIKTMIFVTAFFTICWFPHIAFNIYLLFEEQNANFELLNNVAQATHLTSYLYNAMNPFIYATKFHPVKKILKAMIPCGKKTPVQPPYAPTTTGTRRITSTRQTRF